MKISGILNAVVLTAVIAASSAVAQAGTTVKAVRGKLAASTDGGTTNGLFRLADVERNGTEFQGLLVYVRAALVVHLYGQESYRRGFARCGRSLGPCWEERS